MSFINKENANIFVPAAFLELDSIFLNVYVNANPVACVLFWGPIAGFRTEHWEIPLISKT